MATAKEKTANPVTQRNSQRARPTKEQILAERRSIRQDLGSHRSVLLTPKVDGLVFRWERDLLRGGQNQVQRLLNMGWIIYEGEWDVADQSAVERDKGLGTGHRVVGGQFDGKPYYLVLMCIDAEVYAADQEIKEEALRAKEDELRADVQSDGGYGYIG